MPRANGQDWRSHLAKGTFKMLACRYKLLRLNYHSLTTHTDKISFKFIKGRVEGGKEDALPKLTPVQSFSRSPTTIALKA